MITAILTDGIVQIPFFNHDEKIFDLQIEPFGWTLIHIKEIGVKRRSK